MTLDYVLTLFCKAIPCMSDNSHYEFQSKGQTYQEFMPMPVTTLGMISSPEHQQAKVSLKQMIIFICTPLNISRTPRKLEVCLDHRFKHSHTTLGQEDQYLQGLPGKGRGTVYRRHTHRWVFLVTVHWRYPALAAQPPP